jgi:hypothetical protein
VLPADHLQAPNARCCPSGNGRTTARLHEGSGHPDAPVSCPDGPPRVGRSTAASRSVDSPVDPLLSFAPPVADWLAFLADLLAAEVLRDMTSRNDAA